MTRKKTIFPKHLIIRAILPLCLFLVAVASMLYLQQLYSSPQELAEAIKQMGPIGPVIAIVIFAIEIIAAPIPGFLIAIASGYAFGTWPGMLYTYIGNLLGTYIAFMLARHYGKPFVTHLVRPEKLKKYDRILKDKGIPFLWFVYLVPILPADIITFLVGLSHLSTRRFMIMIAIAYIPYVVALNSFGARLYETGLDTTISLIAMAVLAIAGISLIFFSKTGRSYKK